MGLEAGGRGGTKEKKEEEKKKEKTPPCRSSNECVTDQIDLPTNRSTNQPTDTALALALAHVRRTNLLTMQLEFRLFPVDGFVSFCLLTYE